MTEAAPTTATRNPPTPKEIGLTQVKQYVWSRYVDQEWDRDVKVDEEEYLRLFRQHYETSSPETDPEVFYYAILLFERSYQIADKKQRNETLLLAKRLFDYYIRLTGERSWEVITDRLADIKATFSGDGLSLEGIEEKIRVTEAAEETESIRTLREAAPEGMLLVPGGIHLIGADKAQGAIEPFYIDKTPVTNQQYARFLEDTKYRPSKYWGQEGFSRPNQPVVGVSYFDAMKYAQWCAKSLPSAQQWEAAARGTDGRSYPWGEGLDAGKASYDHTGPEAGLLDVGSFKDNVSPIGCVDMAGLVWEWTDTWYDEEHESKIVKGGSWADPADMLTCDFAFYAPPKEKSDIVGFRCVKVIE